MSHKMRRVGAAVFILVTFSLVIACLGDVERSVVFEEVGEYSDGGMAVALLVVGDLVYLCEFDRGVVILDTSDPANPVEIGSFLDGGRPNNLWVEGDLIYVADGLEILRFRLEEGV